MKNQVLKFISGQVTPQINVPQFVMLFSIHEGKQVKMMAKKCGPKKSELKGVLHKDATIYPFGHEANRNHDDIVFNIQKE